MQMGGSLSELVVLDEADVCCMLHLLFHTLQCMHICCILICIYCCEWLVFARNINHHATTVAKKI